MWRKDPRSRFMVLCILILILILGFVSAETVMNPESPSSDATKRSFLETVVFSLFWQPDSGESRDPHVWPVSY